MMLAIRIEQTGGPEVLTPVQLPNREPEEAEVRVRHHAIGVNFIDTYHRSGLYPTKLPATIGQEAAGGVEAIGAGGVDFLPGDRVAYAGVSGAYAEANLVDYRRLVKLPSSISFETAAAGMLKGLTTEFLLNRCAVVLRGDAILVHAAAGGVGSLLTQWAHSLGALVIGAVSTEPKAELARRQGCDHVLVYGASPLAGHVRGLTNGAGVKVVYDGVGASTLEDSLKSLARRGILVSFGNASGAPPPVDPFRLMRGGSLFLTRPTLADYIATPDELAASAAGLFKMIEAGLVRIAVNQTFALAEARAAHEALEARRTTGSILLIP